MGCDIMIIVVEYPKSGGTWLVSLLGDLLNKPKRDVYINDSEKNFWGNYFWYQGHENIGLVHDCVAKSHEYPGTSLHSSEATTIHLIRDGRDVIVSKYFYENEFLVKNGLKNNGIVDKYAYVKNIAEEWNRFVTEWKEVADFECRYESILAYPESVLLDICKYLNQSVNEHEIENAIKQNTKQQLAEKIGKVFKHNTFVRKGVAGDWKNFFDESMKDKFKQVAGKTLIEFGYEKDNEW